MSPPLPPHNYTDASLRNPMFLSQLVLINFTLSITTPNVAHIGDRELTPGMTDPECKTAFPPSVRRIIRRLPEKHVVGPYAQRSITRMADKEPAGDCAIMQRPRVPMRRHHLRCPKRSILPTPVGHPQPTCCGFVDFGPKAFGRRSWWSTYHKANITTSCAEVKQKGSYGTWF